MSEIIYNNNLIIGSKERSRAQKLLFDSALLLSDFMIENYGVLVTGNDNGILTNEWKVAKTGSNTVSVQPGRAILSDGTYPRKVELETEATINIPATNGTYDLFIRYSETNNEEGTIEANNGSAEIVGTDTKFTEIFALNRRIIIGGVAYSVLSVTDDENLTLGSNYAGSSDSGLNFQTGGWFRVFPSGASDNYIYKYDSYSFVLRSEEMVAGDYWLAQIVVSGTVITTVTDKRSLNLFKLFLTDITLAPAVPELEYGLKPTNFRIHDMYGSDDLVQSAESDNTAADGSKGDLNRLYVSTKWGFDDITGYGDSDSNFYIDNAAYSAAGYFPEDNFNNQYIYIPSKGNCRIINSTATASNVTKLQVALEGVAIDLSTVTVNSSNPATIHLNADGYAIYAVPLGAGDIPVKEKAYKKEETTLGINGYIDQVSVLKLNVGTKYRIYMTPVFYVTYKGKGETVELLHGASSGTYYSSATTETETYSYPLIVKHPLIDDDGEVTATANEFGFTISLAGWSKAEEIEYAWTIYGEADFTQANHAKMEKKVTASRQIQVTTTEKKRYGIAVRGLISRFACTDVKKTSIVSGAGGVPPNPVIIYQATEIFHTARVSITAVSDNGDGSFNLTVGSPVKGHNYSASFDLRDGDYIKGLTGRLLVDGNDVAFLVASIFSTTGTTATIRVENLPGNTSTPKNSDYGYIGYAPTLSSVNAQNARRIAKIRELEEDFIITSTVVKVLYVWMYSTKVPITRIRQDNLLGSYSSGADTVTLNAKGTYNKTLDIEIVPANSSDGKREIVVDLYAPDDADKNRAGVKVEIIVYGYPKK